MGHKRTLPQLTKLVRFGSKADVRAAGRVCPLSGGKQTSLANFHELIWLRVSVLVPVIEAYNLHDERIVFVLAYSR